MSETLTTAAPAGWYDDPADASAYRWWSGEAWTTYTSPKPAPVAFTQPETVAAPTFSRDPSMRQDYSEPATHTTVASAVAPVPAGTVGIWFMGFLPLMSLAFSGVIVLLYLLSGLNLPGLITYPVIIGLAWLFGWLDVSALRKRGYQPPSLLWMLAVPPLGYLIARGRVIRAQSGRAWPQELAYVASFATLVAGTFALTASLVVPPAPIASAPDTSGSDSSADADASAIDPYEQFYAGVFTDENPRSVAGLELILANALATDGSVKVDCSSVGDIVHATTFDCLAFDSLTSTEAKLVVEISPLDEVFFSVRPLDGSADGDALHGAGNGVVVEQAESAGSIPDERYPWQAQIEQSLAQHGYRTVSCADAADLIDKNSTFDCYAENQSGMYFRLNVTITDLGNIGFTEFPLTADDLPDSGQSA